MICTLFYMLLYVTALFESSISIMVQANIEWACTFPLTHGINLFSRLIPKNRKKIDMKAKFKHRLKPTALKPSKPLKRCSYYIHENAIPIPSCIRTS